MNPELNKQDLTSEEYREYDIPGRSAPYRIDAPIALYTRPGGTTHRVLDSAGVVHCVPTVGQNGTVLRWKNKAGSDPVQF